MPVALPMRRSSNGVWARIASVVIVFGASSVAPLGDSRHVAASVEPTLPELAKRFEAQVRPLLVHYCHKCHSEDRIEADIDLAQFTSLEQVRKRPGDWQRLGEMLDSDQMPPKGARQPTADERASLKVWVRAFLAFEAKARAGDPGRVVLRRLSNAEYTYTIRDLTGVAELDPAREFPVDGAAGEGFTNTGNALVMSPALVTKYLDAAKHVAAHAVLLPDGFRFSKYATRRDWTNDALARIRAFYGQFTDDAGGEKVNLQGIEFETNQGGRLPIEKYLAATLREREALVSGKTTIAATAEEHGLNARYLDSLWQMLNDSSRGSLVLDQVRAQWRGAKASDAAKLATEITRWQRSLWRFTSVGHIGKLNGPKAWLEPVTPVATRQELKWKLPESPDGDCVVLYLVAGDAGDGNANDYLVWERPRLILPGRPDLLLRDVRRVTHALAARREQVVGSVAKCLAAAAEASESQGALDVPALAQKHLVDAESLSAWLEYLGIAAGGPVKLGTPIARRMESASGYSFIKGWVGDDALSVVANSSDQHVRIPGNMRPHSIAVHPAPKLSVAIGWRSPASCTLSVEGSVQHAHPECGNGIAWTVELRRGATRQRLAAGVSHGPTVIRVGPIEKIAVRAGDVVSLVVNPRDGNHACDLTAIDLTMRDGTHEWNLARDCSSDLLAGNPHKDGRGNADVWHFYSEPAVGSSAHVIPSDSLLAKWQSATTAAERQQLALALQRLLQTGGSKRPGHPPDAALYRQLTSLGGPLLSAAQRSLASHPAGGESARSNFGLDAGQFGKHPNGSTIESASLCVRAPCVHEVRLPADLVAGAEFVTTGMLHGETGREGSVQLEIAAASPERSFGLRPTSVAETNSNGPWTSNNRGVSYATPVIVAESSDARKRIEASFDDFRRWFPAALCYTKIVPVDEVVTLTLFHREDEHLQRLMLDDAQKAQLDALWQELRFVSQDALMLVDAFGQLMEYATQDADPKVFEPLRRPIHDRANAFRRQLKDAEPKHLDALVAFAERSYRRPLAEPESNVLRELYARLRAQDLGHDEAFRLTLARVLVAPAFLYRVEKPADGAGQSAVSDFELANRLSYFLWSSQPDAQLLATAKTKSLGESKTLRAQTRRMLADEKVRRLAIEFACQWLHVYGFDQLNEKSERHFPTFGGLRHAMYEETIKFFTDLFRNDRSVLDILDADHTYLNGDLAAHYGIPGVTGPEWRRVDGVKAFARGGILTQAATLAKQSGASRTSPILRGNWLCEVLLGEKLPKPPKDVPQLADIVPDGLTERQHIERHSSDPACAKCHARMDPFGFALENFDAIGRFRKKDAGGLAIQAQTTLPDGVKIDGLAGLRSYLLSARREAFLAQFSRKLLGYALGRSVQLSDEPLLLEIRAALSAGEFRVGAAIETIVLSRPFREIRGRETALEE